MTAPRGGKAARRRRPVRHRRTRSRQSAEPSARALPNRPLLLSALSGMTIAGYLAITSVLGGSPAGCGAGSGCDVVQASPLASLLGVSTAALGVALYGALAAVALFVRDARLHSRLALSLSGAGLAVSLYLTAVSIFGLSATCVWCLASLAAVTACFGVSLHQVWKGASSGAWLRDVAATATISLVLVVGLHLYDEESSLGSGDEVGAPTLRALAIHLKESGARFYGAASCSHCSDQKALFRDAAPLLPYVECEPEGRHGPQAPACRAANIRRYPTWIIRDERHEGLLTVDALAARSGFGSRER